MDTEQNNFIQTIKVKETLYKGHRMLVEAAKRDVHGHEISSYYARNVDFTDYKDKINEKIDFLKYANKSLIKHGEYLYEVAYTDIDYEYAYEYYKDKQINNFGCSSVRKNNLFGRNFDWFYDNTCTFIVRTPKIEDRHASIGIAGGMNELTTENVLNRNNEGYRILPFHILDGINDAGLVCNINVVHSYRNQSVKSIPTEREELEMSFEMLPRYILDHYSNARDAVEDIKKHISLINVKKLEDLSYEIHVMIADSEHTYVLEVNENNIVDYIECNKMTNFHQLDLVTNSDGSVYTSADKEEDTAHDAITVNGIDKFGAGLERWNIINSEYANISNADEMMELMSNKINYKRAYGWDGETEADPENVSWYSESTGVFDGIEFTVNTPSSEYDAVNMKEKMANAFNSRDRDVDEDRTWHTTHSTVYDMNTLTLYVKSQSEETEESSYSISLNENNVETVWKKGIGEGSVQTKDTGCSAKGYCSVAEGLLTSVLVADNAVEEWNDGKAAHAEGGGTTASGSYSHAEGNNTVTNNPYEHAEGHFNISHLTQQYYPNAGNTIHSLGIGSNLQNRKNAVEIMQNGDQYIIGIGGYDGTNIESAQTLQAVIANGQAQIEVEEGSGFIIENNILSRDPDIIPTVDYVDQSLSNTIEYFDQQLAAEHNGRVAGDNLKQDKLTAGTGISISTDNVISVTGGGSVDSKLQYIADHLTQTQIETFVAFIQNLERINDEEGE